MSKYSIKDLEKISGIKAHTIRIWEKRYKIVRPNRTDTNIRFYSESDLKRILNISILKRSGYKISKISQFSDERISELVINTSLKNNANASQIENLIVAMINLDEAKFEKILMSQILKFGFEETMVNTIYQLFEKIGMLWQAGSISPFQEHFVSNLVRQKLIVGIDSLINDEIAHPKSFVLFLPESELHEIGLLFSHYLIKKQGHKVIYLGQSVPFEDLAEAQKLKAPDYFITSFINPLIMRSSSKYLLKLSEQFPQQNILLFGNSMLLENLPEFQNVKKFSTIEAFKEFIKTS